MVRTSAGKPRRGWFAAVAWVLGMLVATGGILVLVGACYLQQFIGAGQIARVKADFAACSAALSEYRSRHGAFPTTEQGLLALAVPGTASNWSPRKDPWGRD